MEINLVLQNIDTAIAELLINQNDILLRGLNELNLNGHLTRYLTPLFAEYIVDPEYNGDKLKEHDRKALDIARARMKEIGIKPNKINNYKLTPDIIVHIRNTNEDNLVVLEVKKDSNSKKSKEFDLLKLEHLTINYEGNHYNYKLGIAVIFGTKDEAGNYEIKYFQNGILTQRENLK
ncbi:hypothetical protein [Flavihumibacter sp.]|uniref:hypothetical protein n=1 Tax=Flavihumibacter sp. TaxID=1913981 RepID=UPI002FC5B2E0